MEERNSKKRINNRVTAIVLSIVIAGSLIGVSSVSAGIDPDDIRVFPSGATEYVKAVGGEIPVNKQLEIGGNTITGMFDVATMVFSEGSTITECLDDFGNPVVQVVPDFPTIDLVGGLEIGYTERTPAFPGQYHCDVVFKIVNNARTGQVTQTLWLDVVGSPGFWKNNSEVTTGHLPIALGTGHDVETLAEVKEIYDNNKGKNALDKLAANLLTAKLNLWTLSEGGGANCDTTSIDDQVIEADGLLSGASYVGPTGDPVVKGQAKGPFLDLAGLLDLFNNAENDCVKD